MNYLLDTCVLSELTKPKPAVHVVRWLEQISENARFVSVISLAEIRFGILCAHPGQKKSRLEVWFEQELTPFIAERVLNFDQLVALRWAALRVSHRNAPVLDSQIAATALEHRLTLVTRNVRDFSFEGLRMLNPWEDVAGPGN